MTTPARTKSKSPRDGDRMEFLAARVFQSQGYLVRRGIPLHYGSGDFDATDIDVLGVRFLQPFQLHRMVCDCKDRQRSRPYERIFWAKGLGTFIQASETYVCVPKANAEIIKFARNGRVRVLTQDALENAAGKFQPYGLANPKVAERLLQSLEVAFKSNKRIADAYWSTKRLFLADDPYVGFNNVMLILQRGADALRQKGCGVPATLEAWRVIAGESLVLLSMFLLGIASDTAGLGREQRAKHIVERLTYGDLPARKAEEIFALAKEVGVEAARAANPSLPASMPLPFDLGKVEAPDYAESVAGLAERATLHPELYLPLPLVIDYLLFEQAIQYGIFSEDDYRRAIPGAEVSERLKIARNILIFARDAAKLDLSAFWPDQEDHLPKITPASAAT